MKYKYRAKFNPLKNKWEIQEYKHFIGLTPVFSWESFFISKYLESEKEAQEIINKLQTPAIIYPKVK